MVLGKDVGEYGMGSILMQGGKTVEYGSRSLSFVERRYAQIEKVKLSVLFGLTKFHHYKYVQAVKVYTDHKPLLAI